ncbi:universal stress protein [Halomicrococcus gelatinilyticus]|uniref:universal stress protein n=1 Tax=Halomicrococcus gelatinilyticus TaxID=1702103 RepID=UPI002E164F63
MGDHVLVPMDGSDHSKEALEYALGMSDVDVTAITVVDPYDIDPLTPGYQSPLGKSGMPAYSQEWYQKQWDNAKELHEETREELDDFEGSFESVVKLGKPAKTILRYVEENDVDQVVLGATSESGLSRALMGSTAEAVTKRCPVTVTVVR